jgi:putative spermidine/putrescine transport system substrate-binding protein
MSARLVVLALLFGLCATHALGASPDIGNERDLVIAIRGGASEEWFAKQVIPPFEKKYNVKVRYTVDTSVAALAKVEAQKNNPQTDLIATTPQSHPQAAGKGLVEKVDASRVPNLTKLLDVARDKQGFGPGYGIATLGIMYNSKIYQEKGIPAPASWNDLFDPRVRGRMAMNSVENSWGMEFLVGLAKANGGDEGNVDPAFVRLKQLGKDLIIAKAPANIDEFIQQQAVWVTSYGWNRYIPLKRKGVPVAWTDPKEGSIADMVYFDLIKGAPHPKLAHAFLDHLLSDDVQYSMAKDLGFGPVNKIVKLPAEIAGNVPSETAIAKCYSPDWAYINSVVDKWIDRATRELGK